MMTYRGRSGLRPSVFHPAHLKTSRASQRSSVRIMIVSWMVMAIAFSKVRTPFKTMPSPSGCPSVDCFGFETCSVKHSGLYAIRIYGTKGFVVFTIVLHGFRRVVLADRCLSP